MANGAFFEGLRLALADLRDAASRKAEGKSLPQYVVYEEAACGEPAQFRTYLGELSASEESLANAYVARHFTDSQYTAWIDSGQCPGEFVMCLSTNEAKAA